MVDSNCKAYVQQNPCVECSYGGGEQSLVEEVASGGGGEAGRTGGEHGNEHEEAESEVVEEGVAHCSRRCVLLFLFDNT